MPKVFPRLTTPERQLAREVAMTFAKVCGRVDPARGSSMAGGGLNP